MNAFKQLNLDEDIMSVIEELKFEKPTKIQSEAIPLIREGRDVIGGSATGSGKTLAFSANLISTIKPREGIQALILTPTRELAEQVKENIKLFSKHKKIKVCSIYGGVSMGPQIKNLERVEIVVATPGRLLDHLRNNNIDLTNVKTMILDEADIMLDMGFLDDVELIIRETPKNRQTLLFSATIEPEIARIAKKYLKDPAKIAVDKRVDPKKLTQVYYGVQDNQKFSLLVHLLKSEKKGLVMVFCNSRKTVDFVVNNLKPNGIESIAIHGGFSQDKRTKVMDKFHHSEVLVLACTDVAARGLDFKGVSHVYNFDIPNDPKQYLHRIGRTARAGKEGIAINLLASRDHDNFGKVLDHNNLDLPRVETPRFNRAKIVFTGKEPQRRSGNYRKGGSQGRGYGNRGRGSQGGYSSRGRDSSRPRSRSNSDSNSRNSNSQGDGKPPVRRNLRRD